MNILKNILERLNQKLDASNIFGAIYGLAEPAPDNPKQFFVYEGSGQGKPVTDYDKTQGTAFWRFRSAVTMRQTDALRPVGCQEMYVATYPLRCYAFIRKNSMPCDSNAVEGWVMDMFWKYVSGKDTALRNSLGVTDVFFRPVSVTLNTPDLPNSIEWIHAYFDLDVEVTAKAIESCYDECGVNPIPLPNGQCPPINRVQSVTGLDTDNTDPSNPIVKISVDGITITGEGTPSDPLVAVGGGGGVSVRTQDEGTTIAAVTTTLNFTGGGVTASLASAGNVTINVPAPTAQVNADWNASSGVAEILNKPSIPAAQIQSDWNQANNAALDFIKNKPTIPTGTVESVNSGVNISVDNTDPDNPIINSLADRYKTTSTTSNSVSNGSKSFTVDLNLSYIPLQEILVVHNPANHMHGEVTSYNPATGALVVDIKTHTGSGTYTAWTLNLDGTPVDALTGSGTANEIAYFTAARVLASLPIATYPSLTELSYVKGVTSAIQTQINAKQNALTEGTGIDITSNVITNTAPDQTVVLTAGTGIGVSGTYPNFTITNSRPAYILFKNVDNQTAVTGNANNNLVLGVSIPANTIEVGSIVNIKARVGKTGTTGLTTLRVYANTANSIVSPAPTLLITSTTAAPTQIYNGIDRNAIVKTATNTQTVQANASIQTDAVVGNAALTNSNIDWTVNQFLIFSIQNAANGDSTVLSYIEIEIK